MTSEKHTLQFHSSGSSLGKGLLPEALVAYFCFFVVGALPCNVVDEDPTDGDGRGQVHEDLLCPTPPHTVQGMIAELGRSKQARS